MPHFLLTFGDARRPPVAATIIEAPSMAQARMSGGPTRGFWCAVRRRSQPQRRNDELDPTGTDRQDDVWSRNRRTDPSARPRSWKARAMTGLHSTTGFWELVIV
jgi:hypothetical protein